MPDVGGDEGYGKLHGMVQGEAETEFMLAAAADHAALARFAAAVRDWPLVLHLAGAHRMGGLLYRRLEAAGFPFAPESVRRTLEAQYRTAAVRTLRLQAELHRVLERFQAAGIPALPMRGPALAVQLYADPLCRTSDDLDLLVSRANLAQARRLLLADGYTAIDVVPKRAEAAYLATGGGVGLRHATLDCEMDLSWTPVPCYFCIPMTLADWRPEPGADGVPRLGHEAHLLMLCLHGAKHLWSRHPWMADVAALLRHPVDWPTALSAARARGMRRLLLVGVEWALRAGGRERPPEVAAAVAADPGVGRMCERLRVAFAAEPAWFPGDNLQRVRLHLAMRERLRDRTRYLVRRALTPGPNDWRGLALPPVLSPLYALTRPWRLGVRFAARGIATRRRAGQGPTPAA